MDIGFNEKLASLRSQSGLTQEEVANHLGITKAAVSKWECGQSMPDITLLPAIAELYATTIDDLFGRDDAFDQASVDAAYLRALELFARDHEAGMAFAREQARLHWSSAPLLRMMGMALFTQIPQLPGFGGDSVEGVALEVAQETERMLRRAVALGPSGASMQADLLPLSRILLWTGRRDEAEQLIEERVPQEPNLSVIWLAQLQRDAGQPGDADALLQRALLFSFVEAQATLAALAAEADSNRLEEIAALAEALQSRKEYVALFPTLMPTIRLEQARQHAAEGSYDEAFSMLAAFADSLDETCDVMLHPENPPLLDKVADMMWAEGDETTDVARADAVVGLRTAYANSFATEETWDDMRNDERFAALVSRIATADQGEA